MQWIRPYFGDLSLSAHTSLSSWTHSPHLKTHFKEDCTKKWWIRPLWNLQAFMYQFNFVFDNFCTVGGSSIDSDEWWCNGKGYTLNRIQMTKVTLQINRMEMAMVTLDTEQKLQWLHIEQTQEMSHPWASFLPLPLLLTPLTGERICKIVLPKLHSITHQSTIQLDQLKPTWECQFPCSSPAFERP